MEGVAQYHTKLGTYDGKSQLDLWVLDQTGFASWQLSDEQTHQHPCQQLPVSAALEPELEILVLELVDSEPETSALGPEATEVAEHYNRKDSDNQDVA